MLRDEYMANLEAIERRFPNNRLLTKTDMCRYLGCKPAGLAYSFGITNRLTRESFRMRLAKGKEED